MENVAGVEGVVECERVKVHVMEVDRSSIVVPRVEEKWSDSVV